ncbi:MAG: hypothetical protein FJ304_26430 [Planctomycetes bacterium]|nr:hypothetical protein [Planctomycetota bacterium]
MMNFRVLAVFAACALCGTARGDEKQPAIVPVNKALELDDVVRTAKKLFPADTVIVPLRHEHALFVFMTEKELRELQEIIRPIGEKALAPLPRRKYTLYFKDAKWDDVLDWYAQESGLTLITTVKPTGTFTFTPHAGTMYTLDEAVDILNEGLMKQRFILIRRSMTFFIHPADERVDQRWGRTELTELHKRGRTEIVEVILPIKGVSAENAQKELKRLLTPFGSMVTLEKSNALLVRDTVGNIRRLQQYIEDAALDQPPAKPEPTKTHALNFKGVTWDDVFAWYERITELKADVRVRPMGTLTLRAGDNREFTTNDITDLVNEQLIKQKVLLIPHQRSFAVVSAEGKIDPKLIPAVEFADLSKLARTAIVETRVPLPFELADGDVDELKRLLTPFGEVLYAKGKWLLLRDTVGNIARIHSAIHSPDCSDKFPFAFSFKDARWEDVFQRYEALTGLKDIGKVKPSGTFTFVPTKPTQRFTLAEITDILNDALAGQKLLLIRRHMTFVVVPTNKPIDRDLVPRISTDELATRGRTELVEAILGVKGADVLDFAEQMKKLSGPFGSITPHKSVLIVRDTVGNVTKMRARLAELDVPKK